MDCSLPGSSVHGILQAGILEWVSHSLHQGIFPEPSLLHCGQILYHLSHQGSPYFSFTFLSSCHHPWPSLLLAPPHRPSSPSPAPSFPVPSGWYVCTRLIFFFFLMSQSVTYCILSKIHTHTRTALACILIWSISVFRNPQGKFWTGSISESLEGFFLPHHQPLGHLPSKKTPATSALQVLSFDLCRHHPLVLLCKIFTFKFPMSESQISVSSESFSYLGISKYFLKELRNSYKEAGNILKWSSEGIANWNNW